MHAPCGFRSGGVYLGADERAVFQAFLDLPERRS